VDSLRKMKGILKTRSTLLVLLGSAARPEGLD